MSKEVLSQEEIDLLLREASQAPGEAGTEDKPELGDEIEELRQISLLAMKEVPSTLSALLGKQGQLSLVDIEIVPVRGLDLPDAGGNSAELSCSGGVEGKMVFLLGSAESRVFVSSLIGEDVAEEPLSKEHLAILSDALGQVFEAYRDGLESVLATGVRLKVREVVPGSRPVTRLAKGHPFLVQVTFTISLGDFSGLLIQFLTTGMVKKIASLFGSAFYEAEVEKATDSHGQVRAPDPRPVVQKAEFEELSLSRGVEKHNFDLLLDVPLDITVELGQTRRQLKEVLGLGRGSVLELDRLAGETVDVMVNGKLIAKGEVVVIDESFGVRITDIISPADRLTHLR